MSGRDKFRSDWEKAVEDACGLDIARAKAERDRDRHKAELGQHKAQVKGFGAPPD